MGRSLHHRKSKTLDRARIDELLARVNTESLRRPDVPTVALAVFNDTDEHVPPCRVRFRARLTKPTSEPVTIHDDLGTVVPSRILMNTKVKTSLRVRGIVKCVWLLVLEFVLPNGLSPQTARVFAASYEVPSVVFTDEESLPLRMELLVYETPCHPGDLPTTFPLPVSD